MKKTDWLALSLVLLFLVSGVLTLSNYGISWDEGLGNMFFGERYFYYFTTFQEKYLDFNTELAIHSQHPFNLYLSPFRQYPNEFPALADTLSAASMHLFAYRLHWLDAVDAFHLFTVLLCTLFLWIFYRQAEKHMGVTAALFALLFLGTFPRFWGDMHFNPKDVPETVFFGLTLLAYRSWYDRPRAGGAVLCGALFGCALGIKANALFIPFILLLGVWQWNWTKQPWRNHLLHLKKTFWQYGLMALSAVLVYFASWPYFYADPHRVSGYFKYILSQGSRTGSAGWNWEPFLQFLTTTPEIMLFFLLVGLAAVVLRWKKDASSWWLLLPVWLLLPLVRVSLPGMVNFDGIRHFMEYVPAAALLAGYGSAYLIERLTRGGVLRKRWLAALTITLLSVNLLQIQLTFHPFQHLYYNRLAGGLKGAAALYGEDNASDYWGVSYRQGMRWLNANAEPHSVLYVPVADWLVQLPQSLWLREDIELVGRDLVDSLDEMDRPVYVMFITRSAFYDDVAVECVQQRQPVYSIDVDGVSVMQIYRWNDVSL